jgi:hypothetical protein
MLGELLHTRLITEDRTFGALTGGIDGKDGQTTSFLTEYVHAELIDRGRRSCPRHPADAHTDATATVRQALVDDLLGTGLMVWVDTLDEGHSLGKDGDVTLDDTLDQLCCREFATTVALQVGIDDRWLLDTTVHLQACIF